MHSDQDKDIDNGQLVETVEDTDDNIYVYIDEDDIDKSALNYSQTTIEDINLASQDSAGHTGRGLSVFWLLLKLLVNPIEGWKEVRREKISVDDAQKNCFYPLLAVMAISHFVSYFYGTRLTLSQTIMEAVFSFVGYFAGYFCVVMLLNILLPKEAVKSVDTDFGKVFVILNLSSLCLFSTIMELFPMLSPVLIFLPLWTVYVICRGTRFFRFPEERSILCVGLMCILVVGVPSLIGWALDEFLPTQG